MQEVTALIIKMTLILLAIPIYPHGTGGTVGAGGTQSITQTGSGQNLYYQSQNGKVNTNMSADQIAKWGLGGLLGGLGGGTGGGGNGGGLGGLAGNPTLQALLHQAPTVQE